MQFKQVLVVIDARPKDLGLPTEAYVSVEEVHDVSMVTLHYTSQMCPFSSILFK